MTAPLGPRPDGDDRPSPRRPRRLLGLSAPWPAIVAAAWVALALRSPTVTYHAAPLLVAAAGPAAARLADGNRLTPAAAGAAAALSLLIALGAAGILATAGALGGPSLWHGSGAMEAPLAALVGGLWGWRAATRRRPGLLGLLR